jgi:RNA-directed DNA polymerase
MSEHQREADAFLTQHSSHLAKFSLRLAPSKTRRIEFGRFARDEARKRGHKPVEFTLLGFTRNWKPGRIQTTYKIRESSARGIEGKRNQLSFDSGFDFRAPP